MATGKATNEIEIARSIIDAVELWIDRRYVDFLGHASSAAITKEWFEWFCGEWRVARTIKENSKETVRRYLDTSFRRALSKRDCGEVIDDAAAFIQCQRWSSAKRKDGKASIPRSLVSKIGFFLSSENIVPYDSFARAGVNKLRDTKAAGGKGHLSGDSYAEYLRAFEAEFKEFLPAIQFELAQPWATALFRRLGCPRRLSNSEKFQRKVFDNYLMRIGGRNKPT